MPGEARALALLVAHPDWTDVRIAKEAGLNRTTLYKYPMYIASRKLMKTEGKKNLAGGFKDGETGEVEAWDQTEYEGEKHWDED